MKSRRPVATFPNSTEIRAVVPSFLQKAGDRRRVFADDRPREWSVSTPLLAAPCSGPRCPLLQTRGQASRALSFQSPNFLRLYLPSASALRHPTAPHMDLGWSVESAPAGSTSAAVQ